MAIIDIVFIGVSSFELYRGEPRSRALLPSTEYGGERVWQLWEECQDARLPGMLGKVSYGT